MNKPRKDVMKYRILITHQGEGTSQRIIWMGTVGRYVIQAIMRIFRSYPHHVIREDHD